MGRPRGKSKKLNDEDGSVAGGGEEVCCVSPTPPKTKRRRGRPAHKPLAADDGTDGVEAEDDKQDAGTGEVEEEDAEGGAKPAPAVRPAGKDDDAKGSTAQTGGGKKRRRAQVKRDSDDDTVGEDGVGEGQLRSKSSGSGFRPNGSRRKSTPRRAAEAGVECK